MFEPSGANAVSLDGAQIADLAQFLLELSHLPFQAFDAIESVVKAGVFHGLQPGEDGRERATTFALLWDQRVPGVSHRNLDFNAQGKFRCISRAASQLRPTPVDRKF